MKRILSFVCAAVMLLSLTSCGGTDYKSQLTDPKLKYTLEELNALKEKSHHSYDYDVPAFYKYFEDRGVMIGNIVTSGNLYNYEDNVTKSLMKNFNIYTMENEYKPSSINPSEGVYNVDVCDQFIQWGKDTNAKLRGHTLVWHSQVPDWWFKADPNEPKSLGACKRDGLLCSSEVLQQRMKDYITFMVTRYKGKIDYWDVCNEVLNETGIRRFDDKSYWADIIGDLNGDGYYDDYVELAFKYARECDENAKLLINEFYIEWQDSKAQAMYDMLERFMRNGTRIDGVGFQMHVNTSINVDDVRRNMELIAGLSKVYDECFPEHKGGFKLQVTELDMNLFYGENKEKTFIHWTDEERAYAAKLYGDLMGVFLEFADRGLLDAVVFWGMDDAHSWITRDPMRNGLPVVYDTESKLKDSYYAVVEKSFEKSATVE